jgi:TonB family protein
LVAATFATLLAIAASAQEKDSPHKAPIVEACVDAEGQLVSARIFESSGYPELDNAALKIARANRYSAGTEAGKKKKLSCIKFKVKFVIKDDEPPAAPAAAETP